MADNANKVTIDAEWFAELYANAKSKDHIIKEATIQADEIRQLRMRLFETGKERDELKAKLDGDCRECVSRDEAKFLGNRLAEAERCIEKIAIANNINCLTSWENKYKIIEDAIRAYRGEKETK